MYGWWYTHYISLYQVIFPIKYPKSWWAHWFIPPNHPKVACHRKSLRSTPHSAATSFGMASAAVHGGRRWRWLDWWGGDVPAFLGLGLSWFILVYLGLSWFILVYLGLSWFILVYLGLSWFLGTRSSSITSFGCFFTWISLELPWNWSGDFIEPSRHLGGIWSPNWRETTSP